MKDKDTGPVEVLREFKKKNDKQRSDLRYRGKIEESGLHREAWIKKRVMKGDKALKESVEHSDRTIKTPQFGYDTWISSMSSVIAGCYLMAISLGKYNPVGMIIVHFGGKLLDMARLAYHEKFSSATSVEALKVPDLQHFIEFTDDNKLDLSSLDRNLYRSDGEPWAPEEKEVLKDSLLRGLTLWLGTQGYALKAGTKDEFVDAHGAPLTKPQFEALRDDPARGLDKFLSGRFDMNLESAAPVSAPTSAPSP